MIETLAQLCRHYGLNPSTLLVIYGVKVAAFWLFFLFAIKSLRKREHQATLLWGSASCLAAISPYAYILIRGNHLPLPAVVFFCLLVIATFWGIARKIRAGS